MIDTHCHLYSTEFDSDIALVIERASEEGISKFYLPAIDSTFTERMNGIEKLFPAKCFAMAGLHPCSVNENFKNELLHIEVLLEQRSFKGIGETGLDFYWDKTFVKEQYISLEMQIEYALAYKLPLILHTRNATQQTIDIVKKYSSRGLTGIFHCFGGSLHEADQITAMNFYLGIGGVVTYKNAGLPEVLKNVDMKHIVLETDAPYLTPVPMRGKRNESCYLKYVVEKLALVKEISEEEVKRITTVNAEKIFGI